MSLPDEEYLKSLSLVELQLNHYAHKNCIRELGKANKYINYIEKILKQGVNINIYAMRDKFNKDTGIHLLALNHLLDFQKKAQHWFLTKKEWR